MPFDIAMHSTRGVLDLGAAQWFISVLLSSLEMYCRIDLQYGGTIGGPSFSVEFAICVFKDCSTISQILHSRMLMFLFQFFDILNPAQVPEVRWWMASYGADTPKRHVCYSNSVQIKKLDKGRLQGWKLRSGKKVKTVEHYRDSTGKRRWKGTKALRATEFLG